MVTFFCCYPQIPTMSSPPESDWISMVNETANHFYSSERRCWVDKIDDVLRLTPLIDAFIKECSDRRSWSKNAKAYFKGGK